MAQVARVARVAETGLVEVAADSWEVTAVTVVAMGPEVAAEMRAGCVEDWVGPGVWRVALVALFCIDKRSPL